MKKRRKILFIVPYPSEGASNRLRVEQYIPYLEKEGIGYLIRPFVGKHFYKILYAKAHRLSKTLYFLVAMLNRFLDIFRSFGFDCIFIHREALPVGSAAIENIFSKLGKYIIFDFDDAIFLPNTSKSNNFMEAFKNSNKVSRIIAHSDRVIAGNRYLEEYARKFNDDVAVIPTPIDINKYFPQYLPAGERPVTVGWIGSFTTRDYLDILRPVFERVRSKHKNLKLKFVGNWSGLRDPIKGAEYKEWSFGDELSDLRSFDIGIMPMPDDMWTKGKCAFKIILYMACGIPVVSSSVGMNKEIVRDGGNGFLADSEEQWFDKLSALIEDPGLREKLGRAGRATVEKDYAVSSTAPAFLDAIRCRR